MSLLSAHDLRRTLGERTLLDGVSLTIQERDRIGLVGHNGAGKSTLIRCLTGQETPDGGLVQTRRGLTIGVVQQTPTLDASVTVGEAVLSGLAQRQALKDELEAVESEMASAEGEALKLFIDRHAELSETLERFGGRSFEHEGAAMLSALRAPASERYIHSLSIGEQRRVALAVGLLSRPELLILDEPTNHLDVETIEWLENYLNKYTGGLLLVTHDRYFLDQVTTHMAELDRGRLYMYQGSYTKFLEKKAERAAIEARAEANRQNMIRQELEWVRRGPAARTTKSKSRLQRFDDLVESSPQKEPGEASFQLPHPARIGKTILELHGVSKAYGGRSLVQGLDLIITRGDRIGIVGPNGAGKTTLLRMILGEVEPDTGTIVRGTNTRMVYADQGRTDLNEQNSVIEEVAGDGDKVYIGDRPQQVQTFLKGLLFSPAQQRAKIGTLSGGERTRVALAKQLREPGNLLILDEPTNDLDLATLRVLEEALANYPGCVLVVSHDRWFLDRVTTAVLVFEGQGRVTLFEGGHADWRSHRPTPPSPSAPRVAKAPAIAKKPSKRRSYQLEVEFRGMEESILEAEARVQTLEAELSDPTTLKTLGPELAERVSSLEEAKNRVERLYARWEELSELEPYGGS